MKKLILAALLISNTASANWMVGVGSTKSISVGYNNVYLTAAAPNKDFSAEYITDTEHVKVDKRLKNYVGIGYFNEYLMVGALVGKEDRLSRELNNNVSRVDTINKFGAEVMLTYKVLGVGYNTLTESAVIGLNWRF